MKNNYGGDSKSYDDETDDINKTEKINFGGFPPIIYISNEEKKKKEFKKKMEDNVNVDNISKLNILNIKNILKEKK